MLFENSISMDMKPTEEALSLIRLVVSYFSQYLDFDINEIDQIKQTISIIISSLKLYWIEQENIKIKIDFNQKELHTRIFFPNQDKQKIKLNQDSDNIKVLKALVDNIILEQQEDQQFIIHMVKIKRDKNAKY